MSIRLACAVLLAFMAGLIQPSSGSEVFNPYRVLLVIGDQWEDSSSYLIDIPLSKAPEFDHTIRPKGMDFFQLVVMLKSWGNLRIGDKLEKMSGLAKSRKSALLLGFKMVGTTGFEPVTSCL
ncbi:MAG: hypothetical protein V1794_11775 [Candidatus Glassbacteria bacterium]